MTWDEHCVRLRDIAVEAGLGSDVLLLLDVVLALGEGPLDGALDVFIFIEAGHRLLAALGRSAPQSHEISRQLLLEMLEELKAQRPPILVLRLDEHWALQAPADLRRTAAEARSKLDAMMTEESDAQPRRRGGREAQGSSAADDELLTALESGEFASRGRGRVRDVDEPLANRVLPAGAERKADFVTIKVWYGTTRRQTERQEPNEYYGGERADGSRLEFGRCEVSVPHDHRYGKVERPRWWRFERGEDPARDVSLLSVSPLDAAQFAGEIRGEKAPSALIFVHGYNVGFAQAVRQTAQLAYDLQFPGLPLLFTWPAKAKLAAYFADEASMEAAVAPLAAFLEQVCLGCGQQRVHFVAHSMGARCLIRAALDLGARVQAPLCRQFVLTAPDIDRDELSFRAEALAGAAARVTLYASSNDKAIIASRKVHSHPRAGESGANVLVLPQIDTVDVSTVNTGLLGHSFHAENASVISDLFSLLELELPPEKRARLEKLQHAKGFFWRFAP
jgi:esterase/lipase superfamily enzyme